MSVRRCENESGPRILTSGAAHWRDACRRGIYYPSLKSFSDTRSGLREAFNYPNGIGPTHMEEWTVVLKKPDGFTFEVIEADFAEWTDDGKFLNFRNVQAGKEGLKALATVPKNPTTEQLQDFVIDLFKAMGQITAASFERESVAGFFRGRRATLDVHLEPKSDDHF